jgi:polyhydroxyalkanoate synthase
LKRLEVGTTPKTLVWQMDKVKLYRYDRGTPAKCKIPVLVSFAIMNRHDVLDLQPDRSLMKKFLDEGLDIYIMDWGYPTRADRYLTMEDYIDVYMNGAVDFIREELMVFKKLTKWVFVKEEHSQPFMQLLYPEKLIH